MRERLAELNRSSRAYWHIHEFFGGAEDNSSALDCLACTNNAYVRARSCSLRDKRRIAPLDAARTKRWGENFTETSFYDRNWGWYEVTV